MERNQPSEYRLGGSHICFFVFAFCLGGHLLFCFLVNFQSMDTGGYCCLHWAHDWNSTI
jgi:hypothetical protein